MPIQSASDILTRPAVATTAAFATALFEEGRNRALLPSAAYSYTAGTTLLRLCAAPTGVSFPASSFHRRFDTSCCMRLCTDRSRTRLASSWLWISRLWNSFASVCH